MGECILPGKRVELEDVAGRLVLQGDIVHGHTEAAAGGVSRGVGCDAVDRGRAHREHGSGCRSAYHCRPREVVAYRGGWVAHRNRRIAGVRGYRDLIWRTRDR